MNLKIIILIGAIIGIVILALFGVGLKEKAIKSVTNEIPEYNCGKEGICTSCIIEGNTCSCNNQTCQCGNIIVGKEECEL